MLTGADGIALSGDHETLYWTNLTGNHLYSLPTALLRDFETSETVIENAVTVETALPSNTDGMTADNAGNIYRTALSLDGVMRFEEATGAVTRFAHHLEINFEDPEIPNFRIWRIPNVGQPYFAE